MYLREPAYHVDAVGAAQRRGRRLWGNLERGQEGMAGAVGSVAAVQAVKGQSWQHFHISSS